MEPFQKTPPPKTFKVDDPGKAPTIHVQGKTSPGAIQQALQSAHKIAATQLIGALPPTIPPTAVASPPACASIPAVASPLAPTDETVPRQKFSASAAITRSLVLVLKLSVSGAIVMVGTYFTLNTVVPVIKELRHPSAPDAVHAKNAPAFVKAIQETRLVVAKNDANVAYLNAVIGTDPKGSANPFAKPEPVAPAPLPVAVKAPAPVAAPKPVKVTTYAPSDPVIVVVRSSSAPIADTKLRPYNNAIADLKIDGVMGGSSPRIMIDGLLIRTGEIASPRLKLRFTGVDAVKHLIFFQNEDQVIFQRPY